MATVIVTHAINTDGEGLWYPDLRAELTERGHNVKVLELPDPDAPSPDPWLVTLTDAASASAPTGTVLVGHSVGGVNTLRMLQRHNGNPFAGVVLVATMAHEVGLDALAGFFVPAFDWDRIRRAAVEFRLLVAADDRVLTPDPFEHAKQLVTALGATAVVKPSGGHLPNWTPETLPAHVRLPEAAQLVLDCLNHGLGS
jgi:predicted alpha/beta hydrolase family esterase